jgi:DNA-binding PadR family transcriptional regulator
VSIRHAILGVLGRGAMHGYNVASELERLVAGGRYNSAQIYQGLRWLADRGLVTEVPPEPGGGRDRRPFAITAEGRREFDRWLREPPLLSRPLRDDVVVKLAFLGLHDLPRLAKFLERLRRQHLRRLTGAQVRETARGGGTPEEQLSRELASAALRFREEAELRWIDHCLTRLRQVVEVEVDAAGAGEPDGVAPVRRRGGAGDGQA